MKLRLLAFIVGGVFSTAALANLQCPPGLNFVTGDFAIGDGIGVSANKTTAYLIARGNADTNLNAVVFGQQNMCTMLPGTPYFGTGLITYNNGNENAACNFDNMANVWNCSERATRDYLCCN